MSAEADTQASGTNVRFVPHSGQSLGAVERALDRDNFMSAKEARNWGLIGEIIESRDAGRTAPRRRIEPALPQR